MSGMRTLAVIPARGGSKRIPGKNLKIFEGKPILHWAIDTAQEAGVFDAVMVSTDDPEIAASAQAAGAELPFLRSAATADDHATLLDVLSEVVAAYEQRGERFDAVCCILPTAVLMTADRLREGWAMLSTGEYDSVFPVVRFPAPIQRALRRDEAGVIAMFQPEHYRSRSQDLEPAYHDAGQFYWMSSQACLERRPTFEGRAGSLVIDEAEAQDIDTETDWRIAELKHRLMRQGGA